jgi:hypothetical protein
MSPNMDIIKGVISIFHEIWRNNGMVIFQYIEGHQDWKRGQIDDSAQLNVLADRLATKGLSKPPIIALNLLAENAVLLINNKKMTSQHSRHLSDSYSSHQMYKYFQEKHGWTHSTLQTIWWEIHGGSTLKTFYSDTQTTLQKYIHNISTCYAQENMYYEYRSPLC